MKKTFIVLLVSGLCQGQIAEARQLALGPNSPLAYLDLEKPFNEISWVMSHNSTSHAVPTTATTYRANRNRVVADQRYGLDQQFKDGIRTFKLPVHMAAPFNKSALMKQLIPISAAQKAIDIANGSVHRAQQAVDDARQHLKNPQQVLDRAQHELNKKKSHCNHLRGPAKDICKRGISALSRTLDHARGPLKHAQNLVNAATNELQKAQAAAASKLNEFNKKLSDLKVSLENKREPRICHGPARADMETALSHLKWFDKLDLKKLHIDNDKVKTAIIDRLFNSGVAPCSADLTNKSFGEVFGDMKQFVEKYPDEILAVYIQPESITAKQIAAGIAAVIPSHMLYVPTEDGLWPSLNELHGKIIFFISQSPKGSDADKEAFFNNYPWFQGYPSGSASMYNFIAPSVTKAAVKIGLSALMEDLEKSTNLKHGKADPKKVSFLFHFITGETPKKLQVGNVPAPIFSGFPLAAESANRRENIIKRWVYFRDRYKAVPTFLCVDFYNIHDVPELMKELNLHPPA